jgi:hypothetical protein
MDGSMVKRGRVTKLWLVPGILPAFDFTRKEVKKWEQFPQ